jgi:tetratricopeptide (TPR) repeat protein
MRRSRFVPICALVCVLWAGVLASAQDAGVRLDTNESVFSVMAALNACGYDEGLAQSLPVREQIRTEISQASRDPEVASALRQICRFYADHQQPDPSRNVAQYVSLALNLGTPPAFTPKLKESDLPPESIYVLGLVPLLQRYYVAAGLHGIWVRHEKDYEGLVEGYTARMREQLSATDLYLRIPSTGYLGREFVTVLEPLGSPDQANARNYGSNYYLVVSPSKDGALKFEQIRHTYLHYIFDAQLAKRGASMRKLEPLLEQVRSAPMDSSYKQDISLLATESLIKAVEARLKGGPKGAAALKEADVQVAMAEGFVLTRHFYDSLIQFEKQETGFRDYLPDILYYINVPKEKKRASEVEFAKRAAPEVLQARRSREQTLSGAAEKQLANGNLEGAEGIAQEALNTNPEDGNAAFVLAQVASFRGDMKGATSYFQQTLRNSKEPRLVAWSHIYLGRIMDIQEEREAALEHYRAALGTESIAPTAKAAAEQGIKQPYQVPRQSEKQEERDKGSED